MPQLCSRVRTIVSDACSDVVDCASPSTVPVRIWVSAFFVDCTSPGDCTSRKGRRLYRSDGCNTRAAWGRAAAEWPEFQKARRLVELFFIWKTAPSNLERRFRRFREISCVERAKLLDTTIADCMLVEQAPPSKMLRAWATQHDNNASNYLAQVSKLREGVQRNKETKLELQRWNRYNFILYISDAGMITIRL